MESCFSSFVLFLRLVSIFVDTSGRFGGLYVSDPFSLMYQRINKQN